MNDRKPRNNRNEISKLKITPKEQAELDWCYSVLSEEDAAFCEEEALELAYPEIHRHEAAAKLIDLLVELKIRGRNES